MTARKDKQVANGNGGGNGGWKTLIGVLVGIGGLLAAISVPGYQSIASQSAEINDLSEKREVDNRDHRKEMLDISKQLSALQEKHAALKDHLSTTDDKIQLEIRKLDEKLQLEIYAVRERGDIRQSADTARLDDLEADLAVTERSHYAGIAANSERIKALEAAQTKGE